MDFWTYRVDMTECLREVLKRSGWRTVEIVRLEGGDKGWRNVMGYDVCGMGYKLLPKPIESGEIPMAVMASTLPLWECLTRKLGPDCARLMGPAVSWLGKCEVKIDKSRIAAWMEWETGWM